MAHRVVVSPLRHEIDKIKRSRFIASVLPVRSEADVTAAVAELRDAFPDANHHCWAYRLGLEGEAFRYNDDGEPSGSAGRPILQRIDGLPPKKVSPSKEDMKRIRKEYAMVRDARARDDAREDFLGGFVWPVKGRISGVYGSQRILNGQPRRPHFGVDVAAPVGTLVRAPAPGIVTLTHDDMFFSGGTLIIDHGHGLSSTFIHLNAILVKEGERVSQGDPIAEVGATGRVTGPHLDWRMNLQGARLDPQLLVEPMAP